MKPRQLATLPYHPRCEQSYQATEHDVAHKYFQSQPNFTGSVCRSDITKTECRKGHNAEIVWGKHILFYCLIGIVQNGNKGLIFLLGLGGEVNCPYRKFGKHEPKKENYENRYTHPSPNGAPTVGSKPPQPILNRVLLPSLFDVIQIHNVTDKSLATGATGDDSPPAFHLVVEFYAANIRTIEVRCKDVCSLKIRLKKFHPLKVRRVEVRTLEVRFLKVHPLKVHPLEIHAFEVCPTEVRILEVCLVKGRPFEVWPLEARPFEVRYKQFRPLEVRPFEFCFSEVRLKEFCILDIRPLEVHSLEVRHSEVRFLKVRSSEVRTLKACHLEIRFFEVRVLKIRILEGDPLGGLLLQYRFWAAWKSESRPLVIFNSEDRTFEVCQKKIYLLKVRLKEVCPTEVRLYIRIFLPPFVPSLKALLQNFKVFRIRHNSHLHREYEFDLPIYPQDEQEQVALSIGLATKPGHSA